MDWKEHGIKIVRATDLDSNTPQSPGMTRAAAITHARTGASKPWAGTVVVEPDAKTGPCTCTIKLNIRMSAKFVSLNCQNCGGKLEVYPDIDRFACSYCGSEMMVQRRGGTVALKAITAAISKVQVGTD